MQNSLEEGSKLKRQIKWTLIVLSVIELIAMVFAVFHVTQK
jgi:hypothetical protein